jgi:lipopolysaccharide export system protein LptA
MRCETSSPARLLLAVVLTVAVPLAALGQGAEVPFGSLAHDASQPVEITADSLAIDQAAGTASFSGNVLVGQGPLRLAADAMEVTYLETGETGAISRVVATGNVTLTNGAEAAEAERATYHVAEGLIEMEGDVLLTQGANALASERLSIDLNAGTAELQGRVQTIFVPEAAP